MLNDTVIVQTAISAFNNSALWGPAFLWWAFLSLPLFVITYCIRDVLLQRIGWNNENILNNITCMTAGLTLLWVVLFGGNYGVLRDCMSLLPILTSAIIFLTSLFVSSNYTGAAQWFEGWKKWLSISLLILMVALSGGKVWWIVLLQVCSFVVGVVLGRVAGFKMQSIGGIVLIILTVLTAILMQPEYFRYGQLGHLTFLHLLALLLTAVFTVVAFSLFNFKPHGVINNSVYVKLKWLCRVVCVLGVSLFLLTEAVPVFLGTLLALLVMIYMSIVHAKVFEVENLGHKLFALALMLFGIVLVIPVITCLGVLYWGYSPKIQFWREFKRVL